MQQRGVCFPLQRSWNSNKEGLYCIQYLQTHKCLLGTLIFYWGTWGPLPPLQRWDDELHSSLMQRTKNYHWYLHILTLTHRNEKTFASVNQLSFWPQPSLRASHLLPLFWHLNERILNFNFSKLSIEMLLYWQQMTCSHSWVLSCLERTIILCRCCPNLSNGRTICETHPEGGKTCPKGGHNRLFLSKRGEEDASLAIEWTPPFYLAKFESKRYSQSFAVKRRLDYRFVNLSTSPD